MIIRIYIDDECRVRSVGSWQDITTLSVLGFMCTRTCILFHSTLLIVALLKEVLVLIGWKKFRAERTVQDLLEAALIK